MLISNSAWKGQRDLFEDYFLNVVSLLFYKIHEANVLKMAGWCFSKLEQTNKTELKTRLPYLYACGNILVWYIGCEWTSIKSILYLFSVFYFSVPTLSSQNSQKILSFNLLVISTCLVWHKAINVGKQIRIELNSLLG